MNMRQQLRLMLVITTRYLKVKQYTFERCKFVSLMTRDLFQADLGPSCVQVPDDIDVKFGQPN